MLLIWIVYGKSHVIKLIQQEEEFKYCRNQGRSQENCLSLSVTHFSSCTLSSFSLKRDHYDEKNLQIPLTHHILLDAG